MTTLPPNFQFSQSSLQDYLDCPRRFELRYMLRQEWPALKTEPVVALETHMEQGKQFHRMVQQHLTGIPAEQLSGLAKGPALQAWWDHYLTAEPLRGLPENHFLECRLSAPFGGYRLVAQYDLVAVAPGQRLVIVDWKTSQKRTRAEYLAGRMQTRLYPLLLALAGQELNQGAAVVIDQIEMIYWFAAYPTEPEHIYYTQHQFEADRDFLFQLLRQLANQGEVPFSRTDDTERHCAYCRYRSLCETGTSAGDWRQADSSDLDDAEIAIELDIERISEIVI